MIDAETLLAIPRLVVPSDKEPGAFLLYKNTGRKSSIAFGVQNLLGFSGISFDRVGLAATFSSKQGKHRRIAHSVSSS